MFRGAENALRLLDATREGDGVKILSGPKISCLRALAARCYRTI